MKSLNKLMTPEWILFGSILALLAAGYSEAATVHSCQSNRDQCIVKLEEGVVGDRIRVLDDKARPIASGRIIKRRGSFAVVQVAESSQTIRKGYPVIVNIDSRSSSLQWAASFSGPE
jgi:hypothetical protein